MGNIGEERRRIEVLPVTPAPPQPAPEPIATPSSEPPATPAVDPNR